MNNWLDSHCHINDKAFVDDLQEVLEHMACLQVNKAMMVSSYLDDYEYGFSIKHPEICFKHSLGIYPGDADDVDEKLLEKYYEQYCEDRCQAIGEIGLDYYWNKENKERQKEIFSKQLEMAERLDKPVIIHSRNAIQDTYDILKKYRVKAVMHCYSDSSEMAKEFVKLGHYISFSGTITWKNAKEPLKVVKEIPLDRILIETDCPYLTPSPNRGKRNEPANVVYTGMKICEELSLDTESFKKQLNDNYHTLFKL